MTWYFIAKHDVSTCSDDIYVCIDGVSTYSDTYFPHDEDASGHLTFLHCVQVTKIFIDMF